VLVLLLLLLQVLELGMVVAVLAGEGSRMRAACARASSRM
jgi:hypothetical protein